MGLHDFGGRLSALWVWSNGGSAWGCMTLAEGLVPCGCGQMVGQYGVA